MNYATGCAFNLDELFLNLDMSKLKLDCKTAMKMTGDQHRKPVVKKVFAEALKIIINDIIDNNVTFLLPTGARESSFYIKRFTGEDFKNGRQHGKWKDVDYLKSNFSGNQLMFSIKNRYTTKEKPIYVNKELQDKITENTNKGMQYC